jgi:hypothetical protein
MPLADMMSASDLRPQKRHPPVVQGIGSDAACRKADLDV